MGLSDPLWCTSAAQLQQTCTKRKLLENDTKVISLQGGWQLVVVKPLSLMENGSHSMQDTSATGCFTLCMWRSNMSQVLPVLECTTSTAPTEQRFENEIWLRSKVKNSKRTLRFFFFLQLLFQIHNSIWLFNSFIFVYAIVRSSSLDLQKSTDHRSYADNCNLHF